MYNTGMRSGFTRGQTLILALAVLLVLAALGGGGWLVWKSGQAPEISQLIPNSTGPQASSTATASPSPATAVLETVPPLQSAPTEPAALVASPTPAPLDPLACLPGRDKARAARVVEVVSGAVLRVEQDGKNSEVRLIGVDPAGALDQAAALLRELAAGKAVRLLPGGADLDEQSRLRRYILAGETFVNYELVRRGAALPALYPPGDACLETFLTAERLAREESLGYWALNPGSPTSSPAGETSAAPACDCSVQYVCTDFKTRSAAQACYNACGDYRNTTLDPDHNGRACEELP